MIIKDLKNQGIKVTSINLGIKSKLAEGYLYKSGKFYRESQLESASVEEKEDSLTQEISESKYNTDDLYLAAKTIIQSFQKLEGFKDTI